MRFPTGRSALLAVAAVAGAAVYWRGGAVPRRQLGRDIDDAIAEGRATAERLLARSDAGQFDKR
ncbi:MAG: hypothetical protein JF887_12510 [Candidatus Dormibacteraeota bacterium]|uniref:Uncharacterized protein n=1 Tax=Candidatus Amunia macphersoniae TaxID=3127014 RepID=A0A934NGN2_9BACT|nr:hypothetical protein [Candidatus Dormibacteraeota bacterium]